MQSHGTTPVADASLAIFAHELREPLASILLAAQAAGETAGDDLTSRELWAIVERQGRCLARLIDQVMEPGCGSHHQTVLCKAWFDLGAVIMEAVEAVQPRLVDRRHRLTVTLPPDSLRVLADALRVRQVVTNLLANAAKYTGCGGQIDLGLRAADGVISIEVRDNGVGIPPELLPRVFDLFRQGTPSTSGPVGLGIGLALVKSLVELHGGSVRAYSGGIGAGSTFVVLLPQAEPEIGQQPAEVRDTQATSRAEPVWTGSAILDA